MQGELRDDLIALKKDAHRLEDREELMNLSSARLRAITQKVEKDIAKIETQVDGELRSLDKKK